MGCPPACVSCYALGSALRASRCLRRLPLAVLTRLLRACDRLFCKRAAGRWAARRAAPRPRTPDATHRRVRGHACLQSRLVVVLTFGAGIIFARLWQKARAGGQHCLTGVASSLHRSLTQPAQQRATGHGCHSASGEFSFCLKKGPSRAPAPAPSAHPHRGPATASEKPRKRAKKAPTRQRDAGRARAERRRRRQKAVPAATARRQEAPQARRRPTEEGEAGGSYRRSSARTGPEVSREKESQSTEGTGGQKIGRGF